LLRSVQFWRIANADGTELTSQFPADAVVRRLGEAQGRRERRHRIAADGIEILAEGLQTSPHPHLAIYRTRRVNLPRLEDEGVVSVLLLTGRQALAEPTYFAFFPRNVVALLFNNEGPRAGRLADYLNSKFGCTVSLLPVYREDLADVLNSMRVTALEVSIPTSQVPMLSRGDDWAEALDNAQRLLEDGAIRLRVSIGRGGKAADKAPRLERIRDLLGQLLARDLSHFHSAKAVGQEGGTDNPLTVDLIEQKFIARVFVSAEDLAAAQQAAQTAMDVLTSEWQNHREFLDRATPAVDGDPDLGLVTGFVETPEDEPGDGDA
jgi:hypothetical protein